MPILTRNEHISDLAHGRGQIKCSRCSLREISALTVKRVPGPRHPVRQPGAKELEPVGATGMLKPARIDSRDRSPDEEEQSGKAFKHSACT